MVMAICSWEAGTVWLWAPEPPAARAGVAAVIRAKAQKADFKNQLATICTNGKYAGSDESKTSAGRKQSISKAIDVNYEVRTYDKFHRLTVDMTIDEIIDKYSDCIFFLDEVHFIKIGGKSSVKAKKRTKKAEDEEEELEDISGNYIVTTMHRAKLFKTNWKIVFNAKKLSCLK